MTCLVTLKAPVISACEAITVASVASPTSGNQRPVGRHHEKRVLDGLRLGQQQRA